MAARVQNRHVRRALRDRAPEFMDECNELNMTKLVEAVVADLDLDAPEETDPIWDWAFELSEELER